MSTHTRIAAAAVALAATLGATSGGHAATGRTLVLKVSGPKLAAVDLPPRHRGPHSPNSAGDLVIITARLSGDASGRGYLHCTALRPGRNLATEPFLCHRTYVLKDGTITGVAIVRLEGRQPTVGAITGGTGAYAGATGTVSASRGVETLHLS